MRIFSDYLYKDFLVHYQSYFVALKKACSNNNKTEDETTRANKFRSLGASFARLSSLQPIQKNLSGLELEENLMIFQNSFLKMLEPELIEGASTLQNLS